MLLSYNKWFCYNMDNFIEKNKDKIKYWIYEHTHTSSNIIINGIPFLCNPIGYSNENIHLDFQKNIIIWNIKFSILIILLWSYFEIQIQQNYQ